MSECPFCKRNVETPCKHKSAEARCTKGLGPENALRVVRESEGFPRSQKGFGALVMEHGTGVTVSSPQDLSWEGGG